MRFALTEEQEAFGASLDALLESVDTVAAARSWADGNHAPGLDLWSRLAGQGVTALVVPEESAGLGASPVEVVVAFESLGRWAVPGPWVEAAGYLPLVLTGDRLEAVAGGEVATVAVPPHVPLALDADAATSVFVRAGDAIRPAEVGALHRSVDPARRLFSVAAGAGEPIPTPGAAWEAAFEMAVLACSAQLLGSGERLLADSVTYVKQRRQFGREIGSYQAIKHALADVRIALDFARPLLHGAALDPNARDASAAKVACGDAAYLAARTALQVHGAIGYTREFDLSLWVLKVRALVGAWGTPAYHRRRVLEALVSSSSAAEGA